MTQGKGKTKNTPIDERQGKKRTRGNVKLPQTAVEKGERKSASRAGGLKANSTDVERDQSDLSVSNGVTELPTLFHLIIQRYLTNSCEGETYEGQVQGAGTACFEGGHVYKGMFTKGLMDGPGVFTWACGLKYEGEFVRNIPMGQGTYTWPDGSSYKGDIYNGVRHGTGTYICARNGVSYNGQWDKGKRNGKGTVYYNQEKTSWYKGDWVNNNKEGLGVRCYPSGNVYSGEWKSSVRHGEGTMRWLKLGQQYDGMWQDGVQHGRGTHIWILRRPDGSQYSQSNGYTGDFIQGRRHGQGTFYYAGGAIYEGEWKNDKKHGKGKFTFKDGHVFEGKFMDDQMMTPSLNGNRAPTPLCGDDSSVLRQDMAVNIEHLLDKIPERKHDTERKQVEFVILRKGAELRSIYSFYSRLGQAHSPDNTFLMSRLQLWRLLKDCDLHHHDITLTQIDHFIKGDTTTEIHSPFTPMPLRRLLGCLVIVAYHIYSKDMVSEKYLLASCLSKLIADDILPNAKNVKGFLFGQPDLSVVAMNYMKRCWEIYQAYCGVHSAPRDDQTMTCRHLLWMFKDLHLLDNKLTTARLLKIITAESHDPTNVSPCVDLEITFLEFFEVLLGCAVVKCQQVSESLEESRSMSKLDTETRKDEKRQASEKSSQITNSSSPSTGKSRHRSELSPAQEMLASQQDIKTEVSERAHSTEHKEGVRGEGKDTETRGMDTKEETLHQFFYHIFFPAFDHHQLVTKNMKEDKLCQKA